MSINAALMRRPVVVTLAATTLAIGYLLLRCGFGTFPSISVELDLARALPEVPELPPLTQYLLYSPVGPVLAGLIGADTELTFQALHVTIFGVAAAAVIAIITRRFGGVVAWGVVVAFITSQTAVVMTAWLGSYDVFTWLFGTAIVLTRTRRQAAVAGFIGAFGVFEQTFISVALLSLVTGVREPVRDNRYLPALVGLVLGRVVLTLGLGWHGADHDRGYWVRHFGPSTFIEQFVDQLPLFALTAFGGAWVIVIACLRHVAPALERIAWIVAMSVAVAPSALGHDPSRLYALITWPLLVALILRVGPQMANRQLLRINTLALVAGLALPPTFVWAGQVHLAQHHLWHLFWA